MSSILRKITIMVMASFIFIMNAALAKEILETKGLIIDNRLAPSKIKSINEIRLVNFKGKIFSGCGKSIFNPLYKNNYPIKNRTSYKKLDHIVNNNTSILISVEHINIYANLIVDDTSFCSLKEDLENVTIEAYIVNITSQDGRKFNLIYLNSYQLNRELSYYSHDNGLSSRPFRTDYSKRQPLER